MTPTQARDAFVKRLAEYYDTTAKDIQNVLREKYGTFREANIKEYEKYLFEYFTKIKPQEDAKKFVGKIGDQEEIKRLTEQAERTTEYGFPELCPYHNVKVRGNMFWGRKGFTCPVGGRRCMFNYRVEQIAKAQGKQIDWDRINLYFSQGGSGDVEEYKKWVAENLSQTQSD